MNGVQVEKVLVSGNLCQRLYSGNADVIVVYAGKDIVVDLGLVISKRIGSDYFDLTVVF